MNKIVFNGLNFLGDESGDGKLQSVSYDVENSLAHDELSVDTLNCQIKYPLSDDAAPDDSLVKLPYGTECTYYQNNVLMGKFYLVDAQRDTKNKYTFKFQSPVGLLSDTQHYGGVYSAKLASELIEEIIGGKIPYTIKQVFSKIKLYGWLPISTRRDNLKQVLFACGGCIQKNSDGNVYITTLNETTPKVISDSVVFATGPLKNNNSVNTVSVVEHGFVKDESVKTEELFKGELSGNNFTTPKGLAVKNCAIVTWDNPAFNINVTGSTLKESDANYCVVTAGANVVVSGQKYLHTQNIVKKTKAGSSLIEKTAEVKDATLVSLANSASTAERVLAYYGNTITTKPTFLLNGEKPTDIITIANSYGEKSTGFIKSINAQCGMKATRGNCEVVVGYVPPVVVGSRTLVSISVTTPPTKTAYASGDEFDPTGMIVTAKYDDNSTNVINSYFYSPTGALKESDTEITISYTELGVTKTTTTPISVVTLLRFIAITTPPDQTDYYEDDVFNPQGMVVTAYYSDGTSKVVSNYTYSPTSALTKNDTTITVEYTDTGVTANAYVDIVVGDAPNLTSIAITTPPTKTVYKIGEYFNTTGMVVTAYFDNDTSKPVSGYTYSPTSALTQDSTTITVSYTRRGITKTATQAITMKYLTKIEVTTPPTYTAYYEDNNFNKAGMVVKATYSNGESRNLGEAEYTVSPTTLKCGDTQVTISYTETGITKTATQAVTVTYYPYDFTKSVVISQSGTYHLSDIGATHRNLRIVSIGGGNGGAGGSNGTAGTSGSNGIITSGSNGTSGSTSNGGSGGQGGANGLKGDGGKVYSQDIVLDASGDDIVITIGQGGSGGAIGTDGTAGGDTTCTINSTTISSANGTSIPEGYTNTMTNENYASEGTDGVAGANGGNASSKGAEGGSVGSNTGGSGTQGGTYGTQKTTETRGSQSPTVSFSWGTRTQEKTSDFGNSSYPRSTQYYSGKTGINGTSGTGKLYTTGSTKRIGWDGTTTSKNGVTMYDQNTGEIYLEPSNVNLPTDFSRDVQASYTQTVENYSTGSAQGSYDYGRPTIITYFTHYTGTKTFKYDWQVANITYQRGYAGAGGGGAAQDANGSNADGKDGGNGANASAPSTPTKFGAGGNGGHGGGGGGGGGDAYSYVSGNQSWCSFSMWQTGGSGGTAGTGSAGSNGAQGCVIIYYS